MRLESRKLGVSGILMVRFLQRDDEMDRLALGRLQQVELRKVWNSEAAHFTPWLAQEENLALLGETLGLELELESMEKGVGPFRADILCKDTVDEGWVLVENQLGRTDHSHLGQLITYAAGLDAGTVVWVAWRFRAEHRAALDWLNEISPPEVGFFGLEIQLWRIGDSAVAPKFNIVSAPNDWTKRTGGGRRSPGEGLTPLKQMQLEYWTALFELLEERNGPLRPRAPVPRKYAAFAIGAAGIGLEAMIDAGNPEVAVVLILKGPNKRGRFRFFEQERDRIEQEIGESLDWTAGVEPQQSRITLAHPTFNPHKRDTWPAQHEWLAMKLELFHVVFGKQIERMKREYKFG